MTTISSSQFSYNKKSKTFTVDGRVVIFDTNYKLINSKTGNSMLFDFDHSSGGEWDPKTIWVYKSESGNYTLNVGNQDITPAHAQAYLDHKLR